MFSPSLESGSVSISFSESSCSATVLLISPGICKLFDVLCRPKFPLIEVNPESSLLMESESSTSTPGSIGESARTSREFLDDLSVLSRDRLLGLLKYADSDLLLESSPSMISWMFPD